MTASTALEPVVSASAKVPSARRAAPDRIPELDGLRGIAIFLVLGAHFINVTNGPRLAAYFQDLFLLGWSGVDLFFVLSGFLIGGILIGARKRCTSKPFTHGACSVFCPSLFSG